jgi:hypothetical protein
MPPVLEDEQQLKRIVNVYEVGDCELTITRLGLSIRIPGSRQYVTSSWARVVGKAGQTASDVPCFMADDGMKLLLHEKAKVEKRRAKKASKESK